MANNSGASSLYKNNGFTMSAKYCLHNSAIFEYIFLTIVLLFASLVWSLKTVARKYSAK